MNSKRTGIPSPKERIKPKAWEIVLPPQKRGRERFGAILSAASKLIDQFGLSHENVSIKCIADSSATRIATIYHYFASIDAIVAGVAVQYMVAFEQALDEVFARHFDSEVCFIDEVVGTCRRYFAERAGLRELWFDRRSSEAVIDIHAHFRGRLAQKFRDKMADFSMYSADVFYYQIMVNIVAALWELAFQNNPNGDDKVVSEIAAVMLIYSRSRFHGPITVQGSSFE